MKTLQSESEKMASSYYRVLVAEIWTIVKMQYGIYMYIYIYMRRIIFCDNSALGCSSYRRRLPRRDVKMEDVSTARRSERWMEQFLNSGTLLNT